MNKTFRCGRRFRRLRNFSYLLITAEVVFFYLVYLYILAGSYPQYAGNPLLAIFFGIEVLLMLLVRFIFGKIEGKLFYTVDDQGITLHNMAGVITLPWEQFESAASLPLGGRNPCPIYFMVNGRRFVPNQYLDDLAGLDTLIVDKIRSHAQIEPGLDEKLMAYRSLKA